MTIDFIEAGGGDPRAADQICRDAGHDWRTVTAPVDIAGWPAAWRRCGSCGRTVFLWLPAGEAAALQPAERAHDISPDRAADERQGCLFS